jgi:hypothetical protein
MSKNTLLQDILAHFATKTGGSTPPFLPGAADNAGPPQSNDILKTAAQRWRNDPRTPAAQQAICVFMDNFFFIFFSVIER